jgi:hypothetical protein
MVRGKLLILFIITCLNLSAQSITPFTVNIAGFTAQKDDFSLTISAGEAISITNFKSSNGVSLNSGFLQNNPPIVTNIGDELLKIGSNEVSINPNPTKYFTYLTSSFAKQGQLQFQILDVSSNLLFRSRPINSIGNMQSKIDLSTYPAGVFYIQIFFKSSNGASKSGIYKIIKL